MVVLGAVRDVEGDLDVRVEPVEVLAHRADGDPEVSGELLGGRLAPLLEQQQDAAPDDQKWSSMLTAGTYLWAYGCGGGSYTSMSGMGTHGTYHDIWSTDIVGGDAKAVFFMMFGSWLGEWDSTDNLMRSALATSTMGLTCSWAGRPHWYYHHMGLGEPIGYSARLTQNNGGLYQNQVNQNLRGVHIALMGDPTLRLHPVEPPSEDSPDAVRELTQRCTDVLEMYVRRHPDMWMWMHRRWRELQE